MIIATQNARQGFISKTHGATKVLVFSTTIAFLSLGLLAILG